MLNVQSLWLWHEPVHSLLAWIFGWMPVGLRHKPANRVVPDLRVQKKGDCWMSMLDT